LQKLGKAEAKASEIICTQPAGSECLGQEEGART